MKIKNRQIMRFGGFALATAARGWFGTIDGRIWMPDFRNDPSHPRFNGPCIYVFWHEAITAPFYMRGGCRITMLLSPHRDAQWLAEAAQLTGFGTIRGSTYRDSTTALRKLFRITRGTNLAITPDGPRGPRRRMSPGPAFLASRLQLPIILIGVGYDRPWRLNTWDRFAIPKPYSRVRLITSEQLFLPADADRQALTQHRDALEARLNQLTSDAESWAESGRRLPGERPCPKRSMAPAVRRRMRSLDEAAADGVPETGTLSIDNRNRLNKAA